jgi:hypothetical protein
MTRIAAPQLSFADLELRNQGVHLDPVLQGIAGFLQALQSQFHPRGKPFSDGLLFFLAAIRAAQKVGLLSLKVHATASIARRTRTLRRERLMPNSLQGRGPLRRQNGTLFRRHRHQHYGDAAGQTCKGSRAVVREWTTPD